MAELFRLLLLPMLFALLDDLLLHFAGHFFVVIEIFRVTPRPPVSERSVLE